VRSVAALREWDMKRVLQFVFLVCLFGLLCVGAQAQNSQDEWSPEIDTYVQLNSYMRLMFVASRSTDGSTNDSFQFGPNLDITFKPILRNRVRSNDSSKQQYVTFRVGYQYLDNVGKPNENRVVLQLTPRVPLPWSLLLSDRNRADLRVISGNFSWRYRNRLTLERTFKIKSVWLTPYAQGEIFYDSRYATWTRNSYEFGVTFPVRRRIELAPYYQRENDSRSSPPHTNIVGLTMSLYFRNN
jgi:hypothetical protein